MIYRAYRRRPRGPWRSFVSLRVPLGCRRVAVVFLVSAACTSFDGAKPRSVVETEATYFRSRGEATGLHRSW